LARESTETAMKAAEGRVRKELAVLDQVVNKLMMFANKDTRDIVLRREKNDELKDVFHELTVFEFGNRNLDEPLPLTPPSMFLKALKYSQEQRFDAAIEQWRSTYISPDASPGIKIRCRYWIGYEQNNLGRFGDAQESFEAAVAYTKVANASDERRLELERLCIETRLFRMAGREAEGLVEKIDDVVAECEIKHFSETKAAALRTKANILYAISLDAFNLGNIQKALDFMRSAKAVWKPLAAGESNLAERREYVFACYALGEDLEEAQELLKQKVREEARRQYTNCIGHKEKAYYAMIQLMVAKAQKVEDRAQSMDTRANFHVAEAHESEWPFSPLRRRPVSRQDFQDDIKWVSENGLPVVV
jgi:tetratricopeptide (TPR) repeat protein